MATTDIILLAGFAVVALGFGYRNLLASLFGRIVISLGRRIKMGDRVTVAGTEGIVEAIQMRCTVLRTLDNVFMYVPNSIWLTAPVINWSAGDRSRRVRLPITLPADTDLGRTTDALRRAAEQTTGIASKPSPRALIVGIDATGVQLELWAWISESRSVGRTIDELGRNVHAELFRGGSAPRRRSSADSTHTRGSRSSRSGDSASDRPRRSSRRSDDSGRRSRRTEAHSESDTSQPASDNTETTEAKPKVHDDAPAPAEPAPVSVNQENGDGDNGDNEKSVSYGRSKRRVPRR